ncbi:transcription factor Ovo-like 2 [Strongylocentrotus purpuratus]|uniref:C2H2-type domain-containing protein n=2 Tax=Strongylocentrotus purpuratus TaxID=7668 RepID=A0A7M7NAR4_STRPU|nr:transcription factor Ovo-like 2 [Strongylocentrotus purpuratus]
MSSNKPSSNGPTTQNVSNIPTPNVANDTHTQAVYGTESMSPNKLPYNGLTTPDSASLPSTKPTYSFAGDEPTPVNGIKPKPRCSQCFSTFLTERAYTKHMTTYHSQTKPHICGFCGKGFHDKFDLKRHYRTHTGVRPYKCSQCARSFTQRCSLETHVNKVHEMPLAFTFKERREKIYVCEDCGHSVKDAFEHYLHMWVAHSRLAMPKRLRQKVLHRIKYILKAQNGGDKNEEELLADTKVVTQSICQVKILSFGK